MKKRTSQLSGRAVCGGIAVGRAEIHLDDPSIVPEYGLGNEEDAEAEVRAFEVAIQAAEGEAAADLEWARGNLPESEAEIFATHRAILRDPTLVEWVTEKIRRDRVNGAAAVRERFDEFRAILGASSSEIIRNRILDVSDAERLILAHLLGHARQPGVGEDDDEELKILVANNPGPSMLARLDPERVCGLLCEEGTGGGHVAVLARALNLPTLIQVEDLLAKVRDRDTIAIDADQQTALVNPADAELADLRARARQLRILLPPQPSDPRALRITADGHRIHLLGNAGSQREVDAAARVDADGIGLYRTEILYLARNRLPSETELTRIYSQVACSFVSEPIDIRLLDLGSDKHLPATTAPREPNPALGLRSLRFLFANPARRH